MSALMDLFSTPALVPFNRSADICQDIRGDLLSWDSWETNSVRFACFPLGSCLVSCLVACTIWTRGCYILNLPYPDHSDDIPLNVIFLSFCRIWRQNLKRAMWYSRSLGNGSPGYTPLQRIVCIFRVHNHKTRTNYNIAAFFSALVVGCALHYRKIVENEHYGYPQEWFPSVSATIGDRYPERSFFMFFIAITSGMSWLIYETYISHTNLQRTAIPPCWTMVSVDREA